MIINYNVLNYIAANPRVALTALAVCFFTLKNKKKLAFKCGRLLSAFVSLAMWILSTAGMIVAVACATVSTQSLNSWIAIVNDLSEFMRSHVVPMIFLSIYKYEIYIIPKLLLIIEKFVFEHDERIPKVITLREHRVFNIVNLFSSPSLVLLQ